MFERAQQRRVALSKKLEKVEKLSRVTDTSDDSSESDEAAEANDHLGGSVAAQSESIYKTNSTAVEQNSKPSRFAALADNINSWEDQPSRPDFKVTAPAKKTWKPPARNETATASLILRKGSAKCTGSTSTDSNRLEKPETSRSNASANSLAIKAVPKQQSPLTTVRSISVTPSSDVKDGHMADSGTDSLSATDEEKVPSSNMVSVNAKNAISLEVPQGEARPAVSSLAGCRQNKRASVSRTSVGRWRRSSVSRRSEDGEPTRQPVAARLAAWKQKSRESEKTAVGSRGLPSRRPANKCLSKVEEMDEKEIARVIEKEKIVGVAGVQNSGEGMQVVSVTGKGRVSPKKLGLATIGIQEKLSQMCENWKQNEISEKSRLERAAEINALANRWKDGILVDDGNAVESKLEQIGSSAIGGNNQISQNSNPSLGFTVESSSLMPPPPPPPPPLPPPAHLSATPVASGNKTNLISKNDIGSLHTQNASISRAMKFNSCPKPYVKPKAADDVRETEDKSDGKSTRESLETGSDLLTNCLAANFQNNLIAMGYEVCSNGEAAKIELDKVKKSDVPKLPIHKSIMPPPPANHDVSLKKATTTARMVTTTKFDDNERVTVIKKKVATLPMLSASTKLKENSVKRVDSKKSTSAPKRSISNQSGKLYGLIKARARHAVEYGIEDSSGRMPSAKTAVETGSLRCMRDKESVQSDSSSIGDNSASDHSELEQTMTRETFKTPQWESNRNSNKSCRSNEDLRKFNSDSEKGSVYERLEDSDSQVTDNAYSESDESDAKLKPSAVVDADHPANENVYMEMTQTQSSVNKRQQKNVDSRLFLPPKARRVQFASDTDATASSSVSDSDEGAMSSASSVKHSESCDDTYDVIWDTGSDSASSEVLPTSSTVKGRTDLPDLPRRNRADVAKGRPVTIAGPPSAGPPLARPLQHKAETRDQMAAFVERRYQQRRPACHGQADRLKSPSLPHKSVRHRLQSLQEIVRQEEKILIQATNALNVCCQGSTIFVGTSEAVECHRILLVSSRKREALLLEMKRLREGLPCSVPTGLTGRLTAMDIRLPLKPEFIAKIGTVQDTSIHYFLLLLRSGVNIAFAQTVSTLEPMVLGSLEVSNHLHMSALPENFIVDLEIYAMVIPREQKCNTPKKNKMANKQLELLTPKSAHKTKSGSDSLPTIRTSNFVQVASLELTKASVKKTHFALDGVAYACPLQGTIHLKLRQVMDAFVHHRGYLKICVEGSDVWSQRWCSLNSNEIVCWKHPNDELTKEPALTIDLRSCITGALAPVSLSNKGDCTTLELVTARSTYRGTKSTHSDNIVPTRYWLTADTSGECSEWSKRINHVLSDLRAWHPYANPSVRVPLDEIPFQ